MDTDSALSWLTKAEIFAGLQRQDLKLLLTHSERVTFENGQTLIAEGDTRPHFHVLVSGTVKVVLPERREDPDVQRAEEMLLNTMGPGECFGEYSMLDDMPASASVVATEAGKALRVDQPRFRNFLASDDRIGCLVYRNMLRLLVERLKVREGARDLPFLVR